MTSCGDDVSLESRDRGEECFGGVELGHTGAERGDVAVRGA